MLSTSNNRKINDQIAAELRTVHSICSTHTEKMEAIERATALKTLLSNAPVVPMGAPTQPKSIFEFLRDC